MACIIADCDYGRLQVEELYIMMQKRAKKVWMVSAVPDPGMPSWGHLPEFAWHRGLELCCCRLAPSLCRWRCRIERSAQ